MEHRHWASFCSQQIPFEELPPHSAHLPTPLAVCSCSKNIVTWFLYLVAVRAQARTSWRARDAMARLLPDCRALFPWLQHTGNVVPSPSAPPSTRSPWRQCNKFPATFRVALSGSHCGTSLFCFLFVLCTCDCCCCSCCCVPRCSRCSCDYGLPLLLLLLLLRKLK